MHPFIFIVIFFILYDYFFGVSEKERAEAQKPFREPKDNTLREEHLAFLERYLPALKTYDQLKLKEFQYRVRFFISNVHVIGVRTKVTTEDRLLIATAAILPILNYSNWFYPNLKVVFLHPTTMNIQGKRVLGLVGEGIMKNKMLLSRDALFHGFNYTSDKHHTAIHEFMHLIDMADGTVDGVPEVLMDRKEILPWLDLMHQRLRNVLPVYDEKRKFTHREKAEELARLAEYFFEKPLELKSEEPELFKALEKLFAQPKNPAV